MGKVRLSNQYGRGYLEVKFGLHNNRPDVNANTEDHDGVQAKLGSTTLAEVLHVENISKAEAAEAGNN